MFADLRSPGGVYIAAWSNVSGSRVCDLEIGDVIHSVNGEAISTLHELQAKLTDLKPGEPVALLIERNHQLQYVAFEREFSGKGKILRETEDIVLRLREVEVLGVIPQLDGQGWVIQ